MKGFSLVNVVDLRFHKSVGETVSKVVIAENCLRGVLVDTQYGAMFISAMDLLNEEGDFEPEEITLSDIYPPDNSRSFWTLDGAIERASCGNSELETQIKQAWYGKSV